MILCGAPYSGKSTAAMVMIDVLTQMQQQTHLQSSSQQQKFSSASESTYSQDASQMHKLYRCVLIEICLFSCKKIILFLRLFRINPLVMESESTLLGYSTLANDWQDGVLTSILRKANRVKQQRNKN